MSKIISWDKPPEHVHKESIALEAGCVFKSLAEQKNFRSADPKTIELMLIGSMIGNNNPYIKGATSKLANDTQPVQDIINAGICAEHFSDPAHAEFFRLVIEFFAAHKTKPCPNDFKQIAANAGQLDGELLSEFAEFSYSTYMNNRVQPTNLIIRLKNRRAQKLATEAVSGLNTDRAGGMSGLSAETIVNNMAAKVAQAVAALPTTDDTPKQKPFVRPTWESVVAAIQGTPLEVYVEEMSRMGEGLPVDFALLDAISLAAMTLANNKITAAIDDWALPVHMNVYALKLGPSGSGKGVTGAQLLHALDRLSLPRLKGNSEPAIIQYAADNNASCGLYYQPEIKKMLAESGQAANIPNFLLASYDSGEMYSGTKPRGKHATTSVTDSWPSAYVEGQPALLAALPVGRSLDAGLLARFLVSFPILPQRRGTFRMRGSPNIERIAEVYQAAYGSLPRGQRVKHPIRPEFSGDAWIQDCTDEGARSSWERLGGQYCVRFACILDPKGCAKGQLTDDSMRRAGVLCDWYFASAMRLQLLVSDNEDEAVRAKAERFIADNPGCTTRTLLNHLKCDAIKLEKNIGPTIEARGGARRIGKFWHPFVTKTQEAPDVLTTGIPAPGPTPPEIDIKPKQANKEFEI